MGDGKEELMVVVARGSRSVGVVRTDMLLLNVSLLCRLWSGSAHRSRLRRVVLVEYNMATEGSIGCLALPGGFEPRLSDREDGGCCRCSVV